jgi:VanZ family protein
MAMKFHLGYGLAAIGYVTGIFMLSSLPGGKSGPAVQLFANFLHIPLFFGLALCLLLSLTGGQWYRTVSYQLYWVIGLLAGTYAAIDEWHQFFVGGRSASVSDFLLDCLGIAGLLLLHRWLTTHRATA